MASPHGSTPINLGNPKEIGIGDLARHIKALCASRSSIVEAARPMDDPCRRKPDITRAREILGWEPTVSLAEGLARTIAYFRGTASDRPAASEGIALSA